MFNLNVHVLYQNEKIYSVLLLPQVSQPALTNQSE